MSIPKPPVLGELVTLDFEPTEVASDRGSYEMLVDITRSTTIVLRAPEGHSIPEKGVMLYPIEKKNGKIVKNEKKAKAINKLKDGKYDQVFTGDLPGDFSLTVDADDGSAMLTDEATTQAEYEYLVHIKMPEGSDSYADPGVRNR